MRGMRVFYAALLGACIGGIIVMLFYAGDLGLRPTLPKMVVPLCVGVGIWAAWKWRRLDHEIAVRVDRTIEALSRATQFHAGLRKSFLIGTVACALLLAALLIVPLYTSHLHPPTHDRQTLARFVIALVLLLVIVSGWVHFRWALLGRPVLVMDAQGLDHAAFGRIPWASIVGLQYAEIQTRRYTTRILYIAVAQPHRFARQLPALARRLKPSIASPSTKFGELMIALNPLDEPHEVIVAAAVEFRGRVAEPFVDAWHQGMQHHEIQRRLAEQTTA